MIRTILLALGASAVVACSKPDEAPPPVPSASATVAANTPPSAAPSASASATPEPVASAAPTTSGSAAPLDCGTAKNPCPLQGWMRENIQGPMNKSDLPALATALDKSAAFAPAGYTNWASIAKDGASAARSGDLQAAKASCRGCHDQYKQKYKDEMRGRKI